MAGNGKSEKGARFRDPAQSKSETEDSEVKLARRLGEVRWIPREAGRVSTRSKAGAIRVDLR